MASHERPSLSVGEKIKLQLGIVLITGETLLVACAKAVPRLIAGWPFRRLLVVSFLRSAGRLSFSSSRSMKIPTGQAVKSVCDLLHLDCESVEVVNDRHRPPCTLHTIHLDTPAAAHEAGTARLLLYFHGGAYIGPADYRGQLPFVLKCARAARVFDLAILEYSLAPEVTYPGQLIQAVEALGHILRSYSPSQIILGGDSAGGNLLLALLAHIKKPNPYVKELGALDERFYAAFIISPWVGLTSVAPSYTRNAWTDYVTAQKRTQWTGLWKPKFDEVWADPLVGGAQFWDSVPVENILITAGEWECFLDDVVEMANQLGAKASQPRSAVELFIGEKEIHVQCAVDEAVGLLPGSSASKVLQWLKTR